MVPYRRWRGVEAMILLEAATSRVATALAPLGVNCAPERSLKESAGQIRSLTKALEPLALPGELRDLWVWWATERFVRPAFDGFLSPSEALGCREGMIDIGFPSTLMPIAKYGKGMIWAELETAEDPGSRIYFGSYADPNLRLWTVGVSGLFEVLADALESGSVLEWKDGEYRLDPAGLQTALHARRADMDWPGTRWTIPISDDRKWPRHWKAATTS
ncbi:MAG: hypothetical protein HKN24_08115 [Acidimicrobiales bacterium]|nr:hypothetical protein [Acidimicrobiales bacterium]